MSPEQKRAALIKSYPGPSWEKKVKMMTDAQVHSVYMRLLNAKKL